MPRRALLRVLWVFAVTTIILLGAAPARGVTLSFQNGVSGYTGTNDTHLSESDPDTSFGNDPSVSVDGNGGGSLANHALIRFDDIFGPGPDQIPFGSLILSAALKLNVTQSGDVGGNVYRMLQVWNESDTWNDWTGGIQADGSESALAFDATIDSVPGGWLTFNTPGLAATVQAWSSGDANNGWTILPKNASPDGWPFSSSEAAVIADHPILEVSFVPGAPVPEPATALTLVMGAMVLAARVRRRAA